MAAKGIDSRDLHQRQSPPIDLSVGAQPSFDDFSLETVHGATSKDTINELAFMEELLEVILHPTGGDNPAETVPVGVNGEFIHVPIGMNVLLKRKHVEVLARSKSDKIRTVVEEDGLERKNSLTKHTSTRFPFQVLYDPSGIRGMEWLVKVSV